MAGRRAMDMRITHHMRDVNSVLAGGGKPAELTEALRKWVGMAKVPLNADQQISLLYFIYTRLTPNERAADYLIRNFATEIDVEEDD